MRAGPLPARARRASPPGAEVHVPAAQSSRRRRNLKRACAACAAHLELRLARLGPRALGDLLDREPTVDRAVQLRLHLLEPLLVPAAVELLGLPHLAAREMGRGVRHMRV
eukprot:5717934-Prymnesium_polylepis.1